MRLFALTISASVLLLGAVSCDSKNNGESPQTFRSTGQPRIRVQVGEDRSTPFEVSCDGEIRVYEIPNGHPERLIGKFSAGTIGIHPNDGGIVIGGEPVPFPNRCRLVPASGHYFLVRPDLRETEQYRYRGVLDVFKHSGVLRLINQLSVEEYLLGVVGKEMRGKEFTLEALKAQAIVARTFTLYHLRASGAQPLDQAFPGTHRFQTYGGANFETEIVVQAVSETCGQILTSGGKIFQSYYHSTCGGQTASGGLFNERDIEPLSGVECGFCADTPTYHWKATLDAAKLEEKLRGWGAERGIVSGRILGLEPVELTESGHGIYVRVSHSKGVFEMRADRLRTLVDPSGKKLPSSRFRALLDARSGEFRVEGQGHGHGVGLCQRGAGVMAQTREHGDILARYFPGSGLRRIY
jgi:stage II sporulation protein D